jgi:membrane protease subunit (stomatin/prohibitin family)
MAAVGDQNTYLKFKAARAMGDAANNPSGGGGASSGIGLGVGAGIGMTVAGMIKDAMASPGSTQAAPGTGAFCGNCGAKFTEGAKFCPGCGTKRA